MTRLKIALLAGGDSPEREIALQSAALIEAALDHSKYDITVIDLHGRDWHHTAPDGRQWQVDKNDFSITVDGVRKAFDYALIIIHGTPGEDGKLQGYLDMMGVPYSSCSMTSSVITFDKITAKRTLAGRVNLAREVFLRRGEAFDPAQIVAELGMPLFVKPNANGKVIMYADSVTDSMERAISETYRRREVQLAYNKEHGIVPQTIKKDVREILEISTKEHTEKLGKGKKRMSQTELRLTIEKLTAEMKNAAQILEFEHAAYLRDKIKKLKEQYSANPNLKIMKDAEEKSRRRKR